MQLAQEQAELIGQPAVSFWEEKVQWKKAWDQTDDGGICVRVDGRHYVMYPDDKTGFKGRRT